MQSYFEALKTTYLPSRGGAFAKQNPELCLGSQGDCSRFAQDGAIVMPWGAVPAADQLKGIRALRLIPSPEELPIGEVPAFVAALENLEFLSMPAPFILNIAPRSIPVSLSSLMLINTPGCADLMKKREWPDVVHPKLTALQFFDFGGAKELDSLLGISDVKLPALEYLECGIQKPKTKLITISQLTRLKFLTLELVKNADIFRHMNSPLTALSLQGAGGALPFAEIARLEDLEILWLNNLKCSIDFQPLAKLPRLRELKVLNSTRFLNLEAIFECANLTSLEFMACGKPFSPEFKSRLVSKKWERLELYGA